MEAENLRQVEEWLEDNGQVLIVINDQLQWEIGPTGSQAELLIAKEMTAGIPTWDGDYDGLERHRSGVFVPHALREEIQTSLNDEDSIVRRLSSWPITRAFVYIDISDFSKMKTGVQLLVVNALVRMAERVQNAMNEEGRELEAQLCIGDGYIYVWKTAGNAARFAANLAIEIEKRVAQEKNFPEFHFRIGAHVGLVRCFWDPGRNGWNYVGDAINGGNRVLAAIGKDTDDVVFFSGELRSAISTCGTVATNLVQYLHNRGRRSDKHGRHWRVYELNHSARQYF